jgi:hypothetical protein
MMLAVSEQLDIMVEGDASAARHVRESLADIYEAEENRLILLTCATSHFFNDAEENSMLLNSESLKDQNATWKKSADAAMSRRAKMHRSIDTGKATWDISTWGGDHDFQAAAIAYGVPIHVMSPVGIGGITVWSPTPDKTKTATFPLQQDYLIPPDDIVCCLTLERDHYKALKMRK